MQQDDLKNSFKGLAESTTMKKLISVAVLKVYCVYCVLEECGNRKGLPAGQYCTSLNIRALAMKNSNRRHEGPERILHTMVILQVNLVEFL